MVLCAYWAHKLWKHKLTYTTFSIWPTAFSNSNVLSFYFLIPPFLIFHCSEHKNVLSTFLLSFPTYFMVGLFSRHPWPKLPPLPRCGLTKALPGFLDPSCCSEYFMSNPSDNPDNLNVNGPDNLKVKTLTICKLKFDTWQPERKNWQAES